MGKEQDFIALVASELGIPADGAKPLNEAEQESVYASAYAFYEQGNYPQASQLFTHLALCAPFCEKYWRGLAASRQMEQEYTASLHAWALVALLKENDPIPHFHAAECYLSLNEKEEGLKALNAAEGLLTGASEELHLSEKIAILKRIYDTTA